MQFVFYHYFNMLVPQHHCDSLEALKLFSLDNVAEAAVAVLWEVPGWHSYGEIVHGGVVHGGVVHVGDGIDDDVGVDGVDDGDVGDVGDVDQLLVVEHRGVVAIGERLSTHLMIVNIEAR